MDTSDTRESLWRQGSLLPPECVIELGLTNDTEGSHLFVVVSHDCDLAERDFTKEPSAEVVEALLIQSCDANLTHSKSTRLLHIEGNREGERVFFELRASTKSRVDRKVLERFQPDTTCRLVLDESNALSHWLAARYKRAAFPNSLLRRLGDKFLKALGRVGSKNPHAIVGIFMDHEPKGEAEDNEPYELWVYLIFSSEIEGAKEVAQGIVRDLKQRMERELPEKGIIDLRDCDAISDVSFSIYDARRLKFYRLDHVSLRQHPPATLPDIV